MHAGSGDRLGSPEMGNSDVSDSTVPFENDDTFETNSRINYSG